jgi:hypothetical protein
MGSALDAARYYLRTIASPIREGMNPAERVLDALVAEIDAAPVALIDEGELCWSWRHEKEARALEGQRVALLRVGGGS